MRLNPDDAAERARIDQLFKDVFVTNRQGAELFDHLWARFGAHSKVHTDGGIDAVLKTYRSAAQREVMDYINGRCLRADEPQDTNQPQENDL